MPKVDRNSQTRHFIVVGAGIVGLAVARALGRRFEGARVIVIEKEDRLAPHQSSHNSGVVHAGVYYEPGSLKARLCRQGLAATLDYCARHGIRVRQCGKLVVATDELEHTRLQALLSRAERNGVDCHYVSAAEMQEIEPRVHGVAAIHVHETAVVDYREICVQLARDIEAAGGEIVFGQSVEAIAETRDEIVVHTTADSFHGTELVVCAGVYADRMCDLQGLPRDFAMVPFRGDFYRVVGFNEPLTKRLIYPVADPRLPFLGVHLTNTVDGQTTVGPSAMLAFHRDHYTKTAFSCRDTIASLTFSGVWRLLMRYPTAVFNEGLNAASRRRYLSGIRRYCPELTLANLGEHSCGIRAQAVSRDGQLIHDFLFNQTRRSLHVCNAPSPAATAALPIADAIVERLVAND